MDFTSNSPNSHTPFHWLILVFKNLVKAVTGGIVGLVLIGAGWLFWISSQGWWQAIIGLPLMLIGAAIFIIALYGFLAAVFDRRYSKKHCPVCKEITSQNLTGS